MLVCPSCAAMFRGPRSICANDGQTLVPASEIDLRIGSQVGNYRLLDLLGRGGMGVVYKCEHVYIAKPAAIKILHEHTATPEAIARLLQEARAAAIIGHANIIDVSDFGETPDGLTYLVMELVDGESLDEVLAVDGAMTLLRAINIVNQIGRGLGAAHEKGIVHRDLKPANVMLQRRLGRRDIVRRMEARRSSSRDEFEVQRESAYDFVKILDFGAAKFFDASQRAAGDGDAPVGTPHYMAPEVAREEVVDHRVDIYALGVMLYEMLTGTVPFDGDNAMDVLIAHRDRLVPPMRHRNPQAQVTDGAERLIRRAMAKDPDDRPQTMFDFLAELQECYGSEVFLRDVEKQMPAAVAAGIKPRPRRLTEELAELFAEGGGMDVLERALPEDKEE